jgi:hypothetical protein
MSLKITPDVVVLSVEVKPVIVAAVWPPFVHQVAVEKELVAGLYAFTLFNMLPTEMKYSVSFDVVFTEVSREVICISRI